MKQKLEPKALLKANNMAERTTKIAVYGLLVTAFVGVLQLAFTVWQHLDEEPQEKIIVVQERVGTDSAVLRK